MRFQSDVPLRDRLRELGRSRAAPFVFALLVEALIVLLLFTISPRVAPKPRPTAVPVAFDLGTEKADEPEAAPKAEEQAKSKPAGRAGAVVAPVPEVTPPPQPESTPVVADVRWMSRRDYAAIDLARAPSAAPAATADSGPASGARTSGSNDSPVVGRSRTGEPLYAAQWHREPTHAELSAYLPGIAVEGWGEIECRTVENYRVEDCQEIADFPRGSRLAGAVRQAAWQFRVRPPRVGGKYQTGTWVRIHIDYEVIRK